jgi:acylphosphatase
MKAKTRRRVVVHGRVQGVYFRGSTVDRAREVGVQGWVRNCPDGTVEAVFEGSEEQVAEMVRYCGEGPPWARVERLEEFEETPEGLGDFGVVR